MQRIVLLLLIGAALLAGYARTARHVEVSFSAWSEAPARLQVFHAARGSYSESGSVWLEVEPVEREYTLRIRGRSARWLRFDPPLGMATRLCAIEVGGSDRYESASAHQLSAVAEHETCVRLVPQAAADDPQWSIRILTAGADKLERARFWHAVFMVALTLWVALAGIALYLFRRSLAEALRRFPVLPGMAWLDTRLPWVLAGLMLLLGGAYAVITPPGAVADEEAHMAKIVRVAHGTAFGDSGDRLLPNPRAMYGPFSDYLDNKAAFSREQLDRQLQQTLVCEPTTKALPKGANGYFPHQYLLPALLYKAGCATGASFGVFLYAARLLNLLLATALVAWGVARAGRGRWALCVVALLPMSLFQMASISADAVSISLSIAWLGLLSGIAGGTLSPARAGPGLWVLSLAIALLKPGSAWVLAALLFCWPAYTAAGRSFPAALGRYVALPWVIHVGWALLASSEAPVLAGVDPAANLSLLASEPMHFLRAVANTFLGPHLPALAKQMVGVLGWLDVRLSPWAYWVAAVAGLAALASDRREQPDRPWWVPTGSLAVAAGSLVLLALPLYIYWSPLQFPVVQGLQGRYFLPAAAFVAVWCSLRSPAGLRSLAIAVVVCSAVAINGHALQRLYEAYYLIGRF